MKLDLTTPHGQRALENAAILAHEANRGYCEALGDTSQMHWEDTPEPIQNSAKDGVRQIIADPNTTPEQSHDNWCKTKVADGWVHGEVKDLDKKTHPCLVPYAELPAAQRAKDAIFGAVVRETLYCYGPRTMTDKPYSVKGIELPYSCVDADKTYGLVQVVGRATRLAARAALSYLAATGYTVPGDALLGELSIDAVMALTATSVQQAYNWKRSHAWPLIGPDFDQQLPRAVVQWHLVYRIAQAVGWLEGVDFVSSAKLDKQFTSHMWYRAAQRDLTDAIAVQVSREIVADEDRKFMDKTTEK